MISKREIRDLAINSGLPRGWYEGPWFEGDDLKTGLPPCLIDFAVAVDNRASMKARKR